MQSSDSVRGQSTHQGFRRVVVVVLGRRRRRRRRECRISTSVIFGSRLQFLLQFLELHSLRIDPGSQFRIGLIAFGDEAVAVLFLKLSELLKHIVPLIVIRVARHAAGTVLPTFFAFSGRPHKADILQAKAASAEASKAASAATSAGDSSCLLPFPLFPALHFRY
jgi:hypothetical protein